MPVADLDAFFDPADGLVMLATRARLLVDDAAFHAIPGLVDQEALDGHALAPMRTIACAAGPDVVEGDTLTLTLLPTSGPALAAFAGSYRVRRWERVGDGLEVRALLQLLPAS